MVDLWLAREPSCAQSSAHNTIKNKKVYLVDASHIVLPAIILLTTLALVMSGIAIMFQIRRDRLPDATRFENIRELRAQEEQLLAERKAELSIVEQKIH